MYGTQYSNFNLGNISDTLGSAISQQEQQMYAQLESLENNPNPSMQDMITFQANMSIWSSVVQEESSIVKDYGDALKQIVTNTGS